MPLPVLIRMMGDEAPDACARQPRAGCVTSRCAASTSASARENLTEKHWIYYPEDTVFHRIFVQGNASPHCNPPGGFGLTCEITYSPHKPLPCEGEELIERCIDDCIKVGIFSADDPIWAAQPGGHAVRLRGLRPRPASKRRIDPRVAGSARTSCWPAATASGSTTTPTTPSSPARRQLMLCWLCSIPKLGPKCWKAPESGIRDDDSIDDVGRCGMHRQPAAGFFPQPTCREWARQTDRRSRAVCSARYRSDPLSGVVGARITE